MKKHTLIALLLLLASTVHAQTRYADFEVTLLSPLNGDTAYIDQDFMISAMVINNGPDTLRTTDSMAFAMIIDGDPLLFGDGTGNDKPYLAFTGDELLPGDTTKISFSFTLSEGWPTGPLEICVDVQPLNMTDTLLDTALANNRGCANISIEEYDPSSVAGVNANKHVNQLKVYPNPASTQVNFDMDMSANDNVSVYITDIMGRVVLQEDKGIMSKGNHTLTLQTSKLTPGIYLYKVMAGKENYTGNLKIE